MIFWIVAGVVAVVTVGVMLVPLRRADAVAPTRGAFDVNVYKDQLKELEREAAEGRVAESELAAARLEIERRLLAAADTKDAGDGAPKSVGRLPLIGAVVAAPLAAVVLYGALGTPGMPDFPLSERPDISGEAADANKAMESLVATLETRLLQQPDDPRGWVLLGRSYATIGNVDKAVAAFAKALPLTERAPEILTDWAELSLMQREGAFSEEIFNAFVEARQKNPALPKPWFYIGLDRAQAGNYKDAAQTWTDMLAISPADAEYTQAIKEKIATAATDGGFDAQTLKPSDVAQRIADEIARATAEAEAAQPGPSQADVEAASEMPAEDRSAFIRAMVERLATRLEEDPNDPAGWERLMNAYNVLGETEKAEAAKARLQQLQGN